MVGGGGGAAAGAVQRGGRRGSGRRCERAGCSTARRPVASPARIPLDDYTPAQGSQCSTIVDRASSLDSWRRRRRRRLPLVRLSRRLRPARRGTHGPEAPAGSGRSGSSRIDAVRPGAVSTLGSLEGGLYPIQQSVVYCPGQHHSGGDMTLAQFLCTGLLSASLLSLACASDELVVPTPTPRAPAPAAGPFTLPSGDQGFVDLSGAYDLAVEYPPACAVASESLTVPNYRATLAGASTYKGVRVTGGGYTRETVVGNLYPYAGISGHARLSWNNFDFGGCDGEPEALQGDRAIMVCGDGNATSRHRCVDGTDRRESVLRGAWNQAGRLRRCRQAHLHAARLALASLWCCIRRNTGDDALRIGMKILTFAGFRSR